MKYIIEDFGVSYFDVDFGVSYFDVANEGIQLKRGTVFAFYCDFCSFAGMIWNLTDESSDNYLM